MISALGVLQVAPFTGLSGSQRRVAEPAGARLAKVACRDVVIPASLSLVSPAVVTVSPPVYGRDVHHTEGSRRTR